jgi:hypothetical protein
MGYGLTTYNDAGGLTLSSDGKVYGYIGMATYVSIQQPPTNVNIGENGYSTYTINWAGDIIVALPVKANGGTSILYQSRVGNTWTILVHKSTGSLNSLGFDVQEATQVYVFGAPASAPSYGLALYNASGVLSADMTRRPLTFDKYLTFPANTVILALSGITVPAVIGISRREELTNLPIDSTFYANRTYEGAWRLGSGTVVRELFQTYYERSTDQQAASSVIPASNAVFIEASGLT